MRAKAMTILGDGLMISDEKNPKIFYIIDFYKNHLSIIKRTHSSRIYDEIAYFSDDLKLASLEKCYLKFIKREL
jgi:hypothetical protein